MENKRLINEISQIDSELGDQLRQINAKGQIDFRISQILIKISGVLKVKRPGKITKAIEQLREALEIKLNMTDDEYHLTIILDEKIPYTKRVPLCTKPDHFLQLFQSLNITEWQSPRKIIESGNAGVFNAIKNDPRFIDGWATFNKFMGVDSESFVEKVKNCRKPKDFLVLFHQNGILEEHKWSNSRWLGENGFSGLKQAIVKDPRFKDGWYAFKKFMGIKDEISDKEKIANCTTPADFINLFRLNGIRQHQWQTTPFMSSRFSGLYYAILADPRFSENGWIDFRKFMGLSLPWRFRVRKCKEPADFLKLFRECGIQGNQWELTTWMSDNGFDSLCAAITADPRFKSSWAQFRKFMGIEDVESWPEKVKKCIEPEDFINLFRKSGIQGDEWQRTTWLVKNGYQGLLVAITLPGSRFKIWPDFLEFMNIVERREEDEFEQISQLGLEEVIALYHGQEGGAEKLKFYLQFAHKELSEARQNRIVIRAFKELYNRGEKKEKEYLQWDSTLKMPKISMNPPEQTKNNTVIIKGSATGCESVYLSGCWPRHVKVQDDGSFSVTVVLRIGRENEIRLMGIDRKKKIRSGQETFTVMQKGELDDIEATIKLLENLGDQLTKQISEDPGRQEFLAECTERLLIKKFSKSFEDGQQYVKNLLQKTNHPVLKRIIKRVLQNFEWIEESSLPNVQEGSLLFFQKYCAYKIRQAMNMPGRKGINLCNDPGLGKTRTVHAAIADQEAVIFSPNSVVSAWKREADKSLIDPDLLVLHEMKHKERKETIKNNRKKRIVTNVQFLQNTEDKERFALIGGEQKIAVFDEAHSRKNRHSEQSKGAKMIPHRFSINVTATLARTPTELCRMLHTLDPDRKEFKSDKAFQQAFPSSDPESLKQLKLIVDQYTIRFRKHDVMEEIDPSFPLSEQLHRLPKKEHVSPDTLGKFMMTEKQAWAIYEMFKDWPTWFSKYNKHIPTDKIHEEDGLRKGSGLGKLHAYRQVINNPSFINDHSGEDPKMEQNMRIIRKSLREGRKVVIFCFYRAQAQKYADILKKYKPALYTGETANKGLMSDEKTKKPKLFSTDQNGLPTEDPTGEPLTALDYEWQTFQATKERQVLISTYSAGSVGTTFTAGKTTIYDDLPRDCKEDIQAEDRTHRIDPDHQTHATVQYYQMQARYPERFLEQMKKLWVVKDPETKTFEEFKNKQSAVAFAKSLETEKSGTIDVDTAYDKFFAQGTYDQVHSQNLLNQRTMFHLINDGIADEAELKKEDISFVGLENGEKNGNHEEQEDED